MPNMFQPNSSGSSSSSGTGKNYLGTVNGINGNGDFETGTTVGWGLGTVTLTNNFPSGSPTFGSGASGNLSIAAVTSGKLAGAYSMSYVSSAATTAGNFVASDAFTIDKEDQSKVMTVKIYYSPTVNPTNGNWSGTSSNSFGIALYDVTTGGSAGWIMPAGVWAMTQSSGVGIATATFQTTAASTQYRLVVFNANASAGAITMLMDDFALGPQTAPIGPVVTAGTPYTSALVGFGTVVTQVFSYQRDGQYLIGSYYFVSATNTGVQATLSLPSGLNVDTTIVTNAVTSVGGGGSSATPFQHNIVTNTGVSTNLLYFSSSSASIFTGVNGTAWANATSFTGSFRVPIAGWSSNVQMSNDTDTRVVAFLGTNTASTTIGTGATIVPFTVVSDTHGAWSTNQYTIPVTGYYNFQCALQTVAQSLATTGSFFSTIYKNGVQVQPLGITLGNGASNQYYCQGEVNSLFCNAGDVMTFRAANSTSQNLNSSNNYVSIYRISGPAVIAATESVNGRYYASATAISGSLATIVWTTKDFDSHNAMASGLLTIPVSGKYNININVQITGTIALNSQLDMQLQKNSVAISEFQTYAGGAMTAQNAQITDEISCVAGDVIRVQLLSSATLPVVASGNTKVFFSWARVGN